MGWDRIWPGDGQIAIRTGPDGQRDHEKFSGAHIDGFPDGHAKPGMKSFTALAGVFLTKVHGDWAGNLSVWPRSHLRLAEHFRNQSRVAMEEIEMPQPLIRAVVDGGPPTQIICGPGDAVLCHSLLVHQAAANRSIDNRIAVYFRVTLRDIDQRRGELLKIGRANV